MQKAGRASAIGWEFAALIVAPMIGGWWLDEQLGTSPVLTMVGLGIGCVGGFWLLFKTARQLTKDAEALDQKERQERRRDDEP